MTTPQPSPSKSADRREWAALEARVLEYCDGELRRQGVSFSRLHVVHSSRPAYDALVEVWQDRSAYTVGVRLPAPTSAAA
jgi:hypothetical protein